MDADSNNSVEQRSTTSRVEFTNMRNRLRAVSKQNNGKVTTVHDTSQVAPIEPQQQQQYQQQQQEQQQQQRYQQQQQQQQQEPEEEYIEQDFSLENSTDQEESYESYDSNLEQQMAALQNINKALSHPQQPSRHVNHRRHYHNHQQMEEVVEEEDSYGNNRQPDVQTPQRRHQTNQNEDSYHNPSNVQTPQRQTPQRRHQTTHKEDSYHNPSNAQTPQRQTPQRRHQTNHQEDSYHNPPNAQTLQRRHQTNDNDDSYHDPPDVRTPQRRHQTNQNNDSYNDHLTERQTPQRNHQANHEREEKSEEEEEEYSSMNMAYSVTPQWRQQQQSYKEPSIGELSIAEAAAQAATSREYPSSSTPSPSSSPVTKDTESISNDHDNVENNDEMDDSYTEEDSSVVSKESLNKLSNLFAQRSSSLSSLSQSQQQPSEQDLEGPSKKPKSRSKSKKRVLVENEKNGTSKDDVHAALLSRIKEKKVSTSQDDNEEDSVVSKDAKSSSDSDGPPPLNKDPMYAKYFKMLKVGMPMGAVQHAMQRDGLDPSVMDGDHNKPAGSTGVPLKDDPAYAKYFKMLKVGMPMGAVQNAMQRDGVDPTIMDGDHNLPAGNKNENSDSLEGGGPGSKKKKDTHRRARLHWDILRKVRSNSIWALVDKDPDVEKIHIDENEFASLFQAELKPSSQQIIGNSDNKRAVVKVIDPKRANNGGIILARLKMSYEEIADAVHSIDGSVLSAEQLQGIIEYIPTSEERKKLREYMSEPGKDSTKKFEDLCEIEKFMVAMMTVKYPKQKMRALLFKLQFASGIEDLEKDASLVEKACDELSQSVRFRKLLGIVLNIGNRLNTAGQSHKGKAGAFTIDSLLKLNQAKAFDKKTTFLQYIVLVVLRNNELLIRFKADLPTVIKAEKIYWDQCVSDLEEVENQLENVRRIALHQARIESGSTIGTKKSGVDDSDSMSEASMSLEEEVDALRSTSVGTHTLDAIKKVSAIREKVEMTNAKFAEVLEYFGIEDKENMQPHELFQIIVKFCKDFDAAKEEVLEKERQKRVEDRKRQSRTDSGSVASEESNVEKTVPVQTQPRSTPRPTPVARSNRGMASRARVSSLQPNMSTVLNDIKNFSKKTLALATSLKNEHFPEYKTNENTNQDNDKDDSKPPSLLESNNSAHLSGDHRSKDNTPQKQTINQEVHMKTPRENLHFSHLNGIDKHSEGEYRDNNIKKPGFASQSVDDKNKSRNTPADDALLSGNDESDAKMSGDVMEPKYNQSVKNSSEHNVHDYADSVPTDNNEGNKHMIILEKPSVAGITTPFDSSSEKITVDNAMPLVGVENKKNLPTSGRNEQGSQITLIHQSSVGLTESTIDNEREVSLGKVGRNEMNTLPSETEKTTTSRNATRELTLKGSEELINRNDYRKQPFHSENDTEQHSNSSEHTTSSVKGVAPDDQGQRTASLSSRMSSGAMAKQRAKMRRYRKANSANTATVTQKNKFDTMPHSIPSMPLPTNEVFGDDGSKESTRGKPYAKRKSAKPSMSSPINDDTGNDRSKGSTSMSSHAVRRRANPPVPSPRNQDLGDGRPKESTSGPSYSRRRSANLSRYRAQRGRQRGPSSGDAIEPIDEVD
uniref:FH2 domain-containing protein n=1 Tax=Ditylum brightwellii TaxID=49249 RepID=A0A7S4W5J3_9STRA